MDKDWLLQFEKELIEETTNVLILDYYSIENYLYHPDNVLEYKLSKSERFDIERYKSKISSKRTECWNNKYNKTSINVSRSCYGPVMNHIKTEANLPLISDADLIIDDFNSDNFDTMYQQLPMKEWKTSLSELTNITDTNLASTLRFRGKILEKISSVLN
jgi:hypothetical protein